MITIVSGLPRSGTSMMMQMLHAGGMGVIVDDQRKPDAGNTRGYWEFQGVRDGFGWRSLAEGKAVKVVSWVLPLVGECDAKVIYMTRDPRELLNSQRSLVSLYGTLEPMQYTEEVAACILRSEQHQGEKYSRSRWPTLALDYAAVVADPSRVAQAVAYFVGGLDSEKMAAAVDPELYRERAV